MGEKEVEADEKDDEVLNPKIGEKEVEGRDDEDMERDELVLNSKQDDMDRDDC